MCCNSTIISLWLIVKGFFLLTQSGHTLHWHTQSPQDLLFSFSSHIILMHEHHSHRMSADEQSS